MTEINSIGQSSNAAINRVAVRRAAAASQQAAAATQRSGDSVELSDTARLLDQLSRLPDVRQDLVDRVRAEIQNGTYETAEKIEATIDSLLEDL